MYRKHININNKACTLRHLTSSSAKVRPWLKFQIISEKERLLYKFHLNKRRYHLIYTPQDVSVHARLDYHGRKTTLHPHMPFDSFWKINFHSNIKV